MNPNINILKQQQARAWFNKEFRGWSNIWQTLFEHAAYPLYLRPQYCMPIDQTWEVQVSVILLGDAAHLMPPSGDGVNLAMLDALELSECLSNNKDKSF